MTQKICDSSSMLGNYDLYGLFKPCNCAQVFLFESYWERVGMGDK